MLRDVPRSRPGSTRSFDLTNFSLRDMTECGAILRSVGGDSTTLSDAMQRIARYFFTHLRDEQADSEQCVLVRSFVTRRFADLDAGDRELAQAALGRAPRSPSMKCLTLMGTAGIETAWNDRLQSRRYRAIPLISEQFVEQFPMFSQLLQQFGVKIQPRLKPDSDLLMDWQERTHNVFFVPDAVDSPYVPVQRDFVLRFGVKSVLGFGGLLPSGHLFAVILFSNVRIPSETADHFRTLALSAKLALVPHDDGDPPSPVRTSAKEGIPRDRRTVEPTELRLRAEATILRQLLAVHEKTVVADVIQRDRAEARLERFRRDYELLLTSARDGIYGLDLAGNATFLNPAAGKMLGWPLEELAGRPMHALIHYCRADRSPYPSDQCPIHSSLRDGAVHYRSDEIFWRRDGTSFPVEYSSTPIVEDGTLVGAVVMFRDITERREAEETLRSTRDLVQAILDNASAVIYAKDLKGRYKFVNRRFEQLLGRTDAEVTGLTDFEIFPPEVAEAFRANDQEVLAQGKALEREEIAPHADGPHVYLSAKFPLVGPNGELLGVCGHSTDITERKRAAAALAQVEAQYRTIVENAVEGIFQTTPEGRFLAANPALAKMCGYDSPLDLIAGVTDIGRQLYVDPDDRSRFRRLMDRDRVVRGFECRLYRKDRTIFWVSEHARAVVTDDGTVRCYEGTVQDITEQREAQAQLQDTLDRLRTLSKRIEGVREEERSRIARELHDELGVGLTCLKIDLSRVQSLLETGTNSRDRGKLSEKIRSMTEHVDATITAVQRIVAELRPGVLDDLGLVAAIEWQCRDFERRTGIACSCETSAEDMVVASERATAVFRICQEALTNVARHAGATAVMVRLQQVADRIHFTVRDNGCGIPAEKLSDGRSFGLMGMHERVRDLQGTLRIVGNAGQGTTIFMDIALRS